MARGEFVKKLFASYGEDEKFRAPVNAIAHLRNETLALKHRTASLAEARDRAEHAAARACLLKDDIDSTATTIEQYLDDLLFQPLQLLAREAGDL